MSQVQEGELRRLEVARPVESAMGSGEVLRFSVSLARGQWVEVVATQLGVDVEVVLLAPDGSPWVAVDSPTGREGDERLVAVVEAGGEYGVEVRGVESGAPAGRVRVEVVAIRDASERDRELAETEGRFAEAESLRREGTRASLEAARENYSECLERWNRLGHDGRAADALFRLARVESRLGRETEAKRRSREAAERYRSVGDRGREAIALNALASSHHALGESDEALRVVRAALDALENPEHPRLEAPSTVAQCLSTLGAVLRQRGETAEALEAYGRALTLAEARDDRRTKALVLSNMGRLFLAQDLLDSAQDRLRAAVAVWADLDDARNAGSVWNRLGDVARRRASRESDPAARRSRLDDAAHAYQQAFELKGRVGDERGRAIALENLGLVALHQGRFDRAERYFEEARGLFAERGLDADEARTLIDLGRLHQANGDFEKAVAVHREALPRVEALGDPQLVASNLYGLARGLVSLGRSAEAEEHVEPLLERVEEQRFSTRRESFRLAFFESKQQYYELAIEIQMRRAADDDGTAIEKAFALAERRRARVLLDLLGEQRDQIRERVPPDLLRRERDLQGRLNRLAGAERTTSSAVREVTGELEATRSAIRAAMPDRLFESPEIVDARAAAQLLGRGTQLLVFSLGAEGSVVWLVTPGRPIGIEAHRLPPQGVLDAAALRAHMALQREGTDGAVAQARALTELAELILGPVADRLTARRLVVVAEGALLNVPFAALPLPTPGGAGGPGARGPIGSELVRRHEIVHLPSLSVLASLRERVARRSAAPDQLLIAADPVFEPPAADRRTVTTARRGGALARSMRSFGWDDFPPLPATREEAEAIRAVADGPVRELLGFEATKQNLLALDLSRYQILHLATHGLVHRDHPELSGLVFSLYDEDGRPLDGYLRLHEIYGLELEAELAVLSACRTAIGPSVRGEGMLALSRGFFYAGATRLLISHWSVDDVRTMELMRRFYWSLLELRVPPAASLRVAQLSMLESGSPYLASPFAWAGFTFQGDWRMTPLSDDPIEGTDAGGDVEQDVDIDYPNPDDELCDSFPEPWQGEVCRWIRRLAPGGGGG